MMKQQWRIVYQFSGDEFAYQHDLRLPVDKPPVESGGWLNYGGVGINLHQLCEHHVIRIGKPFKM